MRNYFSAAVLAIACSLLCAVPSFAVTLYTYTNGGNNGLWNVAGTWTTDPTGVTLVGSAVPGNNDAVVILNGFTVNLNANVANTGLSVTINNGGALDLSTFQFTSTVSSLSGGGTLRIKSAYFPTVTANNFMASYAAGATLEYYDFAGALPALTSYPNLTFTNTTSGAQAIAFSNATAYTITVAGALQTRNTGAGTLAVNLGTQITNVLGLTVNGNVTIGNNTTLGVGAFNAVHNITLLGNLTNNGKIDLSNGTQYAASTTGAADLTFTGATDNSFACNGITDLYTLTVNKGLSSTNILSVTSTNSANLNFYYVDKLINIAAGTLRLGTNINIPRVYGTGNANYDIGATGVSPMLWIDGATVNTNTAALVVYGKFRITAGSFTSTGGQGTVIREEGQYIIEGGTFTTEKFRPSTTATTHRGSFTMTGGTFNASGTTASDARYSRFALPYPEQVFIMSGGVLNVSNPEPTGGAGNATNGGIHIGCKASNFIVTGGTVNAILSGSASSFLILSAAPFWDFNITRTGGPTTAQLGTIGSVTGTEMTAQPLVVLNHFTISGTNTPIFNSGTLNVTVGGNFSINSGGTYTPNGNTTIFSGSAGQLFTNDGTITGGLYNATVNKPAGTLTLAGAATTFTVSQTLTLSHGVLNDGGKTILALGNIHNEAIHTGTGNITLGGSATQILSGDGNGVFGNLVLNNASTPGASATSDLAVSGTLTLAGTGNSLFDIAHHLLALTSTSSTALNTTGSGFSNAKMIRTSGFQSDAGVQKTYGNLNAFTFAFGVGSNYTPAVIGLTVAPAGYGTITARPVSSRHQFVVAGNTNNLAWYWKVVSSGFTGVSASSVSHTYRYDESSVSPANDDATYVPARYNPTTWTIINSSAQVNQGTNVISFTNVSYIDGDFTAGRLAAFGAVKIFYSKRSGNWSDTGAGTTPWSNASHSGPDATTSPGAGDQVFIGDGSVYNHAITITSNNQASGGLEINTGSTLDVGVYTGHNFGRLENATISGSGLLRISSATATAEFPAGDFGNFIRAGGGIVEYYSSGVDFTIPKSSATPTFLPLISYRYLLLTPGSGRYMAMPDQDINIYNNLTVQGASATGIAYLNAVASRELAVNGNLVVNSGTLQFGNNTAQSIIVDGNVTIASGASFGMAGSGTAATNTLSIAGNLVNNGTLDLANTASYVCNTTFTGTANTFITGTGATTDFNILTVDKGTSQTPVLEVNATAFTLSGGAQPLVLKNGTFRLTSAQTVIIANGADFSIPTSTRLSANGGTLQIAGGDGTDLLLAGTIELLNGTVDVGTGTTDNTIEYAATGSPTIVASGGSLNVRGQVRRSTASSQGGLVYNQSGTSVVAVGMASATATTRGVFEILSPGSSFSMTGGTLRIVRGSGSGAIADLYLQPASNTVSGGTIEIGTGATSQTVDINSIIPVYNVSVTGTTNTAHLEFNGLTLRGSLSIGAGNIFQASGFDVNVAGNFTNLNTSNATGISAGGYQPGSLSQTTTLNGTTANQSMTGVAGNLTNFATLNIINTFTGGSVTLQPSTNLYVSSTLGMYNGVLAGNANTITAISSVYNASTQTNTAGGSVTLAGAGSQGIFGNGNGKFGNVILNNASGAVFGANQEIAGTLTLTNGNLTIGAYSLYLSNTSLTAISGATSAKYIITSGRLSDGGVIKAFAGSLAAQAFTYPVGVSGRFTPATYTITTGTTGGNITLKPVNSKHPSATGPGTAYINYYWNVSHTIVNLTALTHRYTYVAAVEAGTLANYRDARFSGGAWTIGVTAGNPNTTTRIITFTNFTDLAGDYTAGEPTAFVNPTTYTSIASGNWESDGAVWDIDPPGTNIGPPAGSFVIISPGHTVTVTGNDKRMATLSVGGRLHLGTTTGHDFGTVSGTGAGVRTIQIQSSTFPSGNFTSFTSASGGTVEYDGAFTLPTQAVYNNLSFAGSGAKVLPNVNLTINGNLTVSAGTVNNSVSNKDITLTSTTGDFTNNGAFLSGSGAVVVGRNFVNSGAGASFIAGSGTNGLRITGNFTNSAGATFTASTDSLGVRGTLTNSASFVAGAGAIRVTGNLNNTSGNFTGGSGVVSVTGSLTNNSVFNAGTGATTLGGSLTNSGAAAIYYAGASTLTINGSLTNTTSATLDANTSLIGVGKDWTNSATFNAGTGTVNFNGTGAQALSGATTFYNVTRTNGGSLTLGNTITVANLLTLTSGNLISGSASVNLTNTTVQPVTGSATAFVDGRLTISFPNTSGTSRIFPVGKGAIYRPVTLQQNAASTLPVVRVEMINSAPGGSYASTLGGLSNARYYTVDLLSGTINSPTVTLSFNTNAAADETVTVPGNVRIARATSPTGPWTDEGGSGVFSPASPAGYGTSGNTTLSNSTYFALGSTNTVLPVTLSAFSAVLNNGAVELAWTTRTETNNAYFVIERSDETLSFDSIAWIAGAGNSKLENHYAKTDYYPLPNVSYYRLKQVDFDGTSSYSNVVRIKNTGAPRPTLIVYPNPTRVGEKLVLRASNVPDRNVSLSMMDISGKAHVVENRVLDENYEIDINTLVTRYKLGAGMYLITVSTGTFQATRKVVIH
ncbi:MAG TPA: T9SS type A sorting domain-containing protein [Chryseolinea sp.]